MATEWELPGTFTIRSSGNTYNLADDFHQLELDEAAGLSRSSFRKAHGIPVDAPYHLRAEEGVGIGFNEETGRMQYVPVIIPEAERNEIYATGGGSGDGGDDDGKDGGGDSKMRINIDQFGHKPDSDATTRLKSQQDDDFRNGQASSSKTGVGASSYWYNQWEVLIKHYEQKANEEDSANEIRLREDVSLDDNRNINCNLGDTTLANIHKTMESFGSLKRAPHQVDFHKEFIVTCLPHIYKDEWEWNQLRVMQQHGLVKINHEVRQAPNPIVHAMYYIFDHKTH